MTNNLNPQHEEYPADRIDHICDRFEEAIKNGQSPIIQDYLEAIDESYREVLFEELLKVEMCYKEERGRSSSPADDQSQSSSASQSHLELSSDLLPPEDSNAVKKPSAAKYSDSQDEESIPAMIGRYRIIKLLGSGGFGRVYLGFDENLCRHVAVKVPRKDRVRKPADVEAYLIEAQTVAALDHRHIVPILDFGRTDDGRSFTVSKFIEGCDLWDFMQQHQPSHRESAEFVATVAEALHYAHLKEITHRDIKPANILIDKTNLAYVVDFGLALRKENFGIPEGIKGTIPYMSPEQACGQGHFVDGRSDIFSLGAVFYELLTGVRPFNGSTHEEILDRIRNVDPRPPRQIDDSIPQELERICLKCLIKPLNDRWLTARDVAEALQRYLTATGHGTQTLTPSPEGSSSQQSTQELQSSLQRQTRHHIWPEISSHWDLEAAAHGEDPSRDILSLISLRNDVERAWRTWFFARHQCGPGIEEKHAFRGRLFDLVSPRHFFYPHSEANIYRPVEIFLRGDRDQSWPELSQLLRTLADDGNRSGVLLVAGSGSGKTVAAWKAYFDCVTGATDESGNGDTSAILGDYLPCWIRASNELPLFEHFRNISQTNFDAELGQLGPEVLLELLAVSASNVDLLPKTFHGETADRIVAIRRNAVTLVKQYLEYGPPLFLFLDLNHFGELERRVVTLSMAVFQELYGDRHRCIAAYRSAAIDDQALSVLTKNERFREYDLQPLSEQAAVEYLRTFRRFEQSVYRKIGEELGNGSVPEGFPIPVFNIDEDCARLRQLVRRTVRSEPRLGRTDLLSEETKPLISTPLLMHWVSLVRGDQLQKVRNVTHLYREVVRCHLDRERKRGQDRPGSLTDERLLTAFTRIALAILPRAPRTRLPLSDARNILRNPDLGRPDRKGIEYAWWPEDQFWHSGEYYQDRFTEVEFDHVLKSGLFRQDRVETQQTGDLGFVHDSLLYYFAGAVALREYEKPGCPGTYDGVDAPWVEKTAQLLTSDMARWAYAAEFLAGALLSVEVAAEQDMVPSVSELGCELVVPLLVGQGGRDHVELLLRYVRSLVDDPTLREVEHGLLGDGSFLKKHPESVMQQAYNRLQWTGVNTQECQRLAGRILRQYLELPLKQQFSWLRLEYASLRASVFTMHEHRGYVLSVVVLPDGRIVSGSHDNTVKLWDPGTGAVLTMTEHNDSVRSVAALPDGRIVSGSHDHTVKLWDPRAGTVLTMDEHQDVVACVAVLPDGRIISGSEDTTVKLWDPCTGAVLSMDEHQDLVRSVAVLPDERIVSASYDAKVKLWDWNTGTVLTMDEYQNVALSVASLPDGRIVSGGDHAVKIWNPGSGTVLTMNEHEDLVRSVAVLPDGRVVSGSHDHTVKLWDPNAGTVLTMDEHQDLAVCVAALLDGRIVSCGDHTAKLWNPTSGTVVTMNEHQDLVRSIAVLPDERIVSGGHDNTVKLWDPKVGTVITINEHDDLVSSVAVLPDGRIVSGSRDRTVKLWDLASGTVLTMGEHQDWVVSVAVLSDGRIVSGGEDTTVKLWDPRTGSVLTMDEHQCRVISVAVLSDGRIVSGSRDHTVKLWDPSTGSVLTMNEHQDWIVIVALLPDGRIVSGGEDATVKLWDPDTGTILTMNEHDDLIRSVAVLPDGRIVSGSEDSTVKLWDPIAGTVLTMNEHDDSVRCIAVLPDGRIISGGEDTTVKLWDPNTGMVYTMDEHQGRLISVAVLPDGRIFSCGHDHLMKLWDPNLITEPANGTVLTLPLIANCSASFFSEPKIAIGSGGSIVVVAVES